MGKQDSAQGYGEQATREALMRKKLSTLQMLGLAVRVQADCLLELGQHVAETCFNEDYISDIDEYCRDLKAENPGALQDRKSAGECRATDVACIALVLGLIQPPDISYQLADAALFYGACFTHHVLGLRVHLQATKQR